MFKTLNLPLGSTWLSWPTSPSATSREQAHEQGGAGGTGLLSLLGLALTLHTLRISRSVLWQWKCSDFYTQKMFFRNIMWNICYTNWFNYLQGIKLDMMLTYYDMEEPWLLLNWTGLRSSFGGQLTVFRRKDLGLFTPTVGPWPRRGTGWRTTSLPCHHVRVRPESGGKTSQDLPGRWTLPTSTAQTRTGTASLNPLPPAVPNEMFVIWLQLLLLLPPGWGGHPPALELPIIL